MACAFATNAGHAAPIRIAYSSISGAMLPLWIAKDKKLFEKYGVDVEPTSPSSRTRSTSRYSH
jgi:ABC-type nitrate/sulfonate/bicarbonate transport system substrate-binding protein